MNRTISRLLVLSLFLPLTPAMAAFYYERHAEGWHWYAISKENTLPKKRSARLLSPLKNNKIDATQQIKHWRQQIEKALNQAIVTPTVENIHAYLILQNQVSARAQRFSDQWQATLLHYPLLNLSNQIPTTQVAHAAYLTKQQKLTTTHLSQLAKKGGLFFFYRHSCPYCQRFAPILKQFATQYGFHVMGITTDGHTLPEFPHSQINHGQSQRFGVRVTPALFFVEPRQQQIYPVSFGLVSESQLTERLDHIAQQIQVAVNNNSLSKEKRHVP